MERARDRDGQIETKRDEVPCIYSRDPFVRSFDRERERERRATSRGILQGVGVVRWIHIVANQHQQGRVKSEEVSLA